METAHDELWDLLTCHRSEPYHALVYFCLLYEDLTPLI